MKRRNPIFKFSSTISLLMLNHPSESGPTLRRRYLVEDKLEAPPGSDPERTSHHGGRLQGSHRNATNILELSKHDANAPSALQRYLRVKYGKFMSAVLPAPK